jgi:hypothetical protein
MSSRAFSAAAGLTVGASLPAGHAGAALAVGVVALDFSVPAAVGCKEFRFSLSDALKHGLVAVYF